jgi:Tfp pilus assembly protein PilN
MNSVDFLPNDYRRRAANRRSHVWLFIALIIYGGVVGVVATHQLLAQGAAKQQYDRVEVPFVQAQLANTRFAELKSQLAETNGQADLHTYLRHPWPRTRVLAALIEHLPPEVSLTEVTMRREEREHRENRAVPPRSNIAKEDEDTSKKPDARQSLKRLREEIDATRTLICVRGVTSDNSALHRCIRALGESRLFAKADLESLDSMEDDTAPGTASFEMCVELAPGYGQTDGPAEGPSESIAS